MTEPPRVLFLADAGPAVGGGHVMRCLTLATALEAAGARCAFAATPAAEAVLAAFAPDMARLAMKAAGPAAQAKRVAALAADQGARLVVLDHYGLDAAAEAVVMASGATVLAMDDLRRAHACPMVLDSNLGRSEADYPGRGVFAGPDWALVAGPFAALRGMARARRAGGGPVRRVLVSLGLTDVGGITGRVVDALGALPRDVAIDVALGDGAASLPGLQAMAAAGAPVSLHVNTRDMARLMLEADLAVGAGGSSLWERCTMGLPSVSLILAPNQRENTEAAAAAGATAAIEAEGLDEVAGAAAHLIADEAARRAVAQAASELCDGGGAARLARELITL